MTMKTIIPITSFEACRTFAADFSADPAFSDPMLSSEEQLYHNLQKAFEQPARYRVWGVYEDGHMTGLFNFLVLPEDRYAEMIVGLSRKREAYERILSHLARLFPAYLIDFVLNPENHLLREALHARGAVFETEQQKMVLCRPAPLVDVDGVELFSEKYAEQYFALHNKDMYWTGEKVAKAKERFRTLLAIREGQVVGYLDVTHCFEENEPYDLYVAPCFRRMGYGRKLLAKALELNHPAGMMLLVEIDNEAAISLYASMGFEKAEHQNTLTAHWHLPDGR